MASTIHRLRVCLEAGRPFLGRPYNTSSWSALLHRAALWTYASSARPGHIQLSLIWLGSLKGGGQNTWSITGRGTEEGDLYKGTRKLWPDRAQSQDKKGPQKGPATLFREDNAKRSTIFKVRRRYDIMSSPRGEASIPRALAPASTGCLLLYWDALEYRLLSARGTCAGSTQGSGAPACIWGANADVPGGLYKKPPLCCLCVSTHGDFLGPEESVWVLETRPASPGSWCAKWHDDHSTDREQGGQSWRLPNRSGMCPLLVLPWSFPLRENPLVLSHHCRGLMYSRPKGITLDAAAIRPSSLWKCLTVNDRPSLTLLTVVRIDLIRAGDKHPLQRGRIPHHA